MTSITHVPVFTDQENVEIAAKKVAPRIKDPSINVLPKLSKKGIGKTPITFKTGFDTRPALGDVSNSCSRPTTGSGQSKKPDDIFKDKRPSFDDPATPRRRILTSLIEPQPKTILNPKMSETIFEDEIEYMPPNDDDYPDYYEDIWPFEERPTRDDFQWLKRFDFTSGDRIKNDVFTSLDEMISFDETLSDLSTLNIGSPPTYKSLAKMYEPEQAEEFPLGNLMDDFF